MAEIYKTLLHDDEILTPEELAERMKLPVSWVYERNRERSKVRQMGRRSMPVVRTGRRLRYNWREVRQWFDEQSEGTR